MEALLADWRMSRLGFRSHNEDARKEMVSRFWVLFGFWFSVFQVETRGASRDEDGNSADAMEEVLLCSVA